MSNVIARILEPRQAIEKSRQRFSNKDLIRLIIPILVEQLLTLLVGIADTLMVSYAGDAAVSGVSLVNQLIKSATKSSQGVVSKGGKTW